MYIMVSTHVLCKVCSETIGITAWANSDSLYKFMEDYDINTQKVYKAM